MTVRRFAPDTGKTLRLLLLALLLAAGTTALVPLAPVYAESIAVNSTADVVADDGVCTLREAITAANTDTPSGSAPGECPAGNGADTITLPAGTYTLAVPGLPSLTVTVRAGAEETVDFHLSTDVGTVQVKLVGEHTPQGRFMAWATADGEAPLAMAPVLMSSL